MSDEFSKLIAKKKLEQKLTEATNDWVFTFGKHKGRTVDHVLTADPCYICWCEENIEWLVFSEEQLEVAEYDCRSLTEDMWGDGRDLF